MAPRFSIGTREIGPEFPPLVIPEIGINHGGNLSVAKAMVEAAWRAGAELVKHQTHAITDEMSDAAKKVLPGNADISIYDVISNAALSEDDEFEMKTYAESLGLIFLSTPFSRSAVDRLERMGVEAYKVGSGECNNIPLLKYIASKGKPMILSTGMNDLASVRTSVAAISAYGVPLALLHTTNIYPTPFHLVRLGAMEELRDTFPNLVVGLSDHTTSNHACLAATALGASILERHFVDTKTRVGPDVSCSMDPTELSQLIEGSALIAQMRGGRKVAAAEEAPTIRFAFATLVALEDIAPGQPFSEKNVAPMRPGTGEIPAAELERVCGCRATAHIPKGAHLARTDVTW
jgi:N-acetylneuraminate synthase